MMKKFSNKKTALLASLLCIGVTLKSCDDIFNNDEFSCKSAEMKLPEIPKGTLFTEPIDPNITNPVIKDVIEIYPGQKSSANYKGVGAGGLERDLSQMQVRWKFEHDNILINPETGTYYPKEEVVQMPSFQFNFSKGFITNLSDNQIQKGDIITSFQAVITNKCGETNPITAQVKIRNSGNIMQYLHELSGVARTGHIQAFYNNKLYLLFGSGGTVNYSYDLATRKLTTLPPINFSNYGFDMNNPTVKSRLENSLYYGTGWYLPFTTYAQQGAKVYFAMPREATASDDILWEYNLETLQLSKLASIDRTVYDGVLGPADGVHGSRKSAGKMTLWDNKIYYFPLYKDRLLGKTYIGVFDLNTKQWSDEIPLQASELVPPISYHGNPNIDARIYFQLFYALNNQLKLVFEGNREVTYDLNTKMLSVQKSDYKHVAIEKRPTGGFVYDGNYYFLANEVLGGIPQDNAFVLYKKNKNGSAGVANFIAGGKRHNGRQFTPVGNTLFVVGGDAVRYWLEK